MFICNSAGPTDDRDAESHQTLQRVIDLSGRKLTKLDGTGLGSKAEEISRQDNRGDILDLGKRCSAVACPEPVEVHADCAN